MYDESFPFYWIKCVGLSVLHKHSVFCWRISAGLMIPKTVSERWLQEWRRTLPKCKGSAEKNACKVHLFQVNHKSGDPFYPYFPLSPIQAAGTRLAMVVQAMANLGTSIIIAFTYSWELTLLLLLWLPILIISSTAELKMLTSHAAEDKKGLEERYWWEGFTKMTSFRMI